MLDKTKEKDIRHVNATHNTDSHHTLLFQVFLLIQSERCLERHEAEADVWQREKHAPLALLFRGVRKLIELSETDLELRYPLGMGR